MGETFLDPNQEMFIAGSFRDGHVTRKVTSDGAVDLEDLFSSHEEADTRLLLHVAHASQECPCVVVWSPNTDVAVLCIHFYHKLEATQELWFHTGVKDKAWFIPVHSIAVTLGVQLCKMLPAVHTLTGCDSTSSLVRGGKLKPWKLVRKDPQKFRNLTNIGAIMEIPQTQLKTVELLLTLLYDPTTTVGDVDGVRYKLFCLKQARNESLLPTSDCLLQHTKSANYQTLIWKHALEAQPNIPSPVENGWHHDKNGQLTPTLMTITCS